MGVAVKNGGDLSIWLCSVSIFLGPSSFFIPPISLSFCL